MLPFFHPVKESKNVDERKEEAALRACSYRNAPRFLIVPLCLLCARLYRRTPRRYSLSQETRVKVSALLRRGVSLQLRCKSRCDSSLLRISQGLRVSIMESDSCIRHEPLPDELTRSEEKSLISCLWSNIDGAEPARRQNAVFFFFTLPATRDRMTKITVNATQVIRNTNSGFSACAL